ncbi:hypothetical protein ACFSKT_24280 [Paenibacillus xanthanilyticus]
MTDEQLAVLQGKLLLFYTGMTRSASAILRKQADHSAKNADYLMKIKEQCSLLKRDLEEGGRGDGLGAILHEGWELKKRLADGITNPIIDEWYQKAIRNGASGGKVAGAGGGGFLLLCADEQYHEALRREIGLQALEVRLDSQGTRIVACPE